jgi:endonuclease/exonuclease/phosphatase family metal-dependent hydrolase
MTRHDKNALTFLLLFVLVVGILWLNASRRQKMSNETKRSAQQTSVSSASDTITIGEFNIQVFGRTKMSKPEVTEVLCPIARKFDVMLVEEIRDTTDDTAQAYLDCINRLDGPKYAFIESERLGRTLSKEAYAYFYNTETVSYLSGSTKVFNEPQDWFEREPYEATFKSGNFDFTLVGVHVKPLAAAAEIDHLHDVVISTLNSDPDERDVIVLGDFNADGTYFNENSTSTRLLGDEYLWAIGNDRDTMVVTDNTYDRIVLRKADTVEYLPGSAGVIRFDKEFSLSASSTKVVSDHYPVYARFSTIEKDDD